MVLCYKCDEQFYGDECPNCGWEISYKCWNCKTRMVPGYDDTIKCNACGWFECLSCKMCGCGDPWEQERPFSKEEIQEIRMG